MTSSSLFNCLSWVGDLFFMYLPVASTKILQIGFLNELQTASLGVRLAFQRTFQIGKEGRLKFQFLFLGYCLALAAYSCYLVLLMYPIFLGRP